MIPDILPSVFLQAELHATDVSSWKIFFTIFLVYLNGFFVAAQFTIVKVRASQIEVRTDINKSLANVAKSIVNRLDSYLAATQLGITLASLGLGWVGESVMTALIINFFDVVGINISPAAAAKAAVPVAFAIITVLHIVFGELAPKSLAIRFPTQTTLYISWPLRV